MRGNGTYVVTAESGDVAEYEVAPMCTMSVTPTHSDHHRRHHFGRHRRHGRH
jgi:hypothetical protein